MASISEIIDAIAISFALFKINGAIKTDKSEKIEITIKLWAADAVPRIFGIKSSMRIDTHGIANV